MRPYYQDDAVTIYHGDCREILPALNVDLIVTDPPYGIAYSPSGGGRGFRGKGPKIPKTWADSGVVVKGDESPFDPSEVLGVGVPTVLFGANHYASRLPDSPSWLIWDKRDGLPSNKFADCEMAWTNIGGPARVFSHRWYGLMRDSERNEPRYHPTAKPVVVMRWVLSLCPDGLVLDPYMGAGSTLVAAKSLQRRAIGIEIEERYCEIAARRCSQEVLGLSA